MPGLPHRVRLPRLLNPADAPAYQALRLQALRDAPEAFTSSFEEEHLRPLLVAEQRLAPASSTRFWGVFDDAGLLLGMVGLERERRVKNEHKGTVVAMCVAPAAQGRGVGAALLAALLDHARETGLTQLALTVTEGNITALRLYQRAGFVAFGTEPRAIRVDGRYLGKVHMALNLEI